MAVRRTKKLTCSSGPTIELPPGTPSWISAELVEHTLRVWQPRYEATLSPEDAIGILVGAARLMNALSVEPSPKASQSGG